MEERASSSSLNGQNNSLIGVSILFDMNAELLLDPVDQMYTKLGRYIPSPDPRSDLTYNEYLILEGGYYTGFTRKTKPESYGCLLLNTGQLYEGCFHRGKIRGKGRMIDLDGTAYEGEWKNNDINSEGTIIWLDGRVYKGKIKKIKPNGSGVLFFLDSKYEGEFKKGRMHGFGVKTWNDDRIYAGQWKSSKMHGLGIMHWPDKTYIGDFVSNEIKGTGKMEWSNKSVYIGEFLNGKRHGLGNMTSRKHKNGKWENDELIEKYKETIVFENIEKKFENFDEKIKKFLDFRLFGDKKNSFEKSSIFQSNISLISINKNKLDQSSDIGLNSSENDEIEINIPKVENINNFDDSFEGMDRVADSERNKKNMPKIEYSAGFKSKQSISFSPKFSIENNDENKSVSVNIPQLRPDESKNNENESIQSFEKYSVSEQTIENAEKESVQVNLPKLKNSSFESKKNETFQKGFSDNTIDYKDKESISVNIPQLNLQSELKSKKTESFESSKKYSIQEAGLDQTEKESIQVNIPNLKNSKVFSENKGFLNSEKESC